MPVIITYVNDETREFFLSKCLQDNDDGWFRFSDKNERKSLESRGYTEIVNPETANRVPGCEHLYHRHQTRGIDTKFGGPCTTHHMHLEVER